MNDIFIVTKIIAWIVAFYYFFIQVFVWLIRPAIGVKPNFLADNASMIIVFGFLMTYKSKKIGGIIIVIGGLAIATAGLYAGISVNRVEKVLEHSFLFLPALISGIAFIFCKGK